MTQSIITRYLGPTNTKPSHMSATSSSGMLRKRWPYMHEYGDVENHSKIAAQFAKEFKWPGKWQGAALNDKGDMVWVNTSDSFAKNYQFKV